MTRIYLIIITIPLGCNKPKEYQDPNLIQHTIIEKSSIEDKHLINREIREGNNNPIPISSLIKNEHLILRIPFVTCEVCKNQEIESLNYYLRDFKNNIALILSSSSKRDELVFQRMNPTNFKIFEFDSNDSFSFWDQYEKPYAILINEEMEILGFHLAMTSYPEFSNVFYQSIQARWSREKNVDWSMYLGD